MIPEGIYTARAIDWLPGRTNMGDKLIGVLFEIAEGEHKGANAQWTGFFTNKLDKGGVSSRQRALDSMRVCGWDGTAKLETLGSNLVSVKVVHREHDGRTFPEVRFINKLRAAKVPNPFDNVEDFLREIEQDGASIMEFPTADYGADLPY